MIALLGLAALSLGLRTTSVLIPRVPALIRLVVSIVVGAVMTLASLELCRSYRIFEFGLGTLAALAPVGVFDFAKWWFTWRKRRRRG